MSPLFTAGAVRVSSPGSACQNEKNKLFPLLVVQPHMTGINGEGQGKREGAPKRTGASIRTMTLI